MLPDHLRPDLDLIICGTAAGRVSALRGHYYAGRGNQFWGILARSGLTPRRLSPEEDCRLPEFGIGLTDIAKDCAGMDRDLPAGALGDAARIALLARLRDLRPKRVAFNGLGAARAALGAAAAPGAGRLSIAPLPGIEFWALPSTSGAARGSWSPQPWHDLADAMGRVPAMAATG